MVLAEVLGVALKISKFSRICLTYGPALKHYMSKETLKNNILFFNFFVKVSYFYVSIEIQHLKCKNRINIS